MEKEIKEENNTKVINKLFLIGNGLDLSMGIKTSYKDFLRHYLIDSVFKLYSEGVSRGSQYRFYQDSLLSVGFNYKPIETRDEFETFIEKFDDYMEIVSWLKRNQLMHFSIDKSVLFKNIIEKSINGWVDIEAVYYTLLKICLFNNIKELQKLNEDFQYLQERLEEYLLSINNKNINYEDSRYIIHKFRDQIIESDLSYEIQSRSITVKTYYFLNFNYTNYLKKILNNARTFNDIKGEIEVNNIHGILESKDNPMVFGYGDELDSDYKKIEETGDKRAFEFIKSFKYSYNNNLKNLHRFIDSEEFQVCVYGHSCGLSDRVMLNEIFEHENCKSIKVYFYENENGDNDYRSKVMDISRHFNSNQLMRRKVVPFNMQNKIPQIK